METADRIRPTLRPLPVLVALGVVISSGLVHGLWTDRWGESPRVEQAAARVDLVPLTVGAWQGRELEGDGRVFDLAGAQGYWMRQYQLPGGKAPVFAILMCGRAGRMAVHTPEFFYGGARYEMADTRAHEAVPAGPAGTAEFWTARFVKGGPGASALRLYWAWNDGGAWQAPSSPRWEYLGRPFLYKLYVGQEAEGGSAEGPREFLRELLPELNRALFPESTGASPETASPRPALAVTNGGDRK